jgi:hypothetical protein
LPARELLRAGGIVKTPAYIIVAEITHWLRAECCEATTLGMASAVNKLTPEVDTRCTLPVGSAKIYCGDQPTAVGSAAHRMPRATEFLLKGEL